MARIFDAVDEWETYVPDCPGEREGYADDPEHAFTCEIRYLTKSEVDRYVRMSQRARQHGSTKADEEHVRNLLRDSVRNVRNYTINGVEIRTGEDLFNDGEPELMLDVVKAVVGRSHLEKGLAKKLRSPSAIFAARQSKSEYGDAVGVTGQSTLPIPATLTLLTQSDKSATERSGSSATATATQTPTSHGVGHRT